MKIMNTMESINQIDFNIANRKYPAINLRNYKKI